MIVWHLDAKSLLHGIQKFCETFNHTFGSNKAKCGPFADVKINFVIMSQIWKSEKMKYPISLQELLSELKILGIKILGFGLETQIQSIVIYRMIWPRLALWQEIDFLPWIDCSIIIVLIIVVINILVLFMINTIYKGLYTYYINQIWAFLEPP